MTAHPKREKPWGTAHAVWCAKDFISNDFAIINADDYYGSNAFKNAANFFNSSTDQKNYGLVSYKLKDTLSDFGSVSRGVCKVSNGKLSSINEHLKIERRDGIIKDFNSGTTGRIKPPLSASKIKTLSSSHEKRKKTNNKK